MIFNPILYKYVFSGIVYWRLFWMIPCSFIIVLAVGELLRNNEKKVNKILICISVLVLTCLLGTNVFAGAKRGDKNNIYRLSQETVDIGSIMLEYDNTPRCIVSSRLVSSIRLYSGNIEPMYGRNAQGYINRASDEVKVMYNVMESEVPDYNYVLTRAKHWGYNFIVNVESKPISEDTLRYYGYELLQNVDGYNIYYNEDITDESLDGYVWRYNEVGWWLEDAEGNSIKQSVKEVYGINYYFNSYGYAIDNINNDTAKSLSDGEIIVTQFGKDDYDKPSMFYTIDDQKGHFVIVDGGNSDEYEDVLSQIKLYGGTVDAWILTHPHDDHIGAFNEIYKNCKDEIEVKKIYAIDIDSEYYHEVANEWDAIEYFDDFEEIVTVNKLLDDGILEYVKDGSTYTVGEMSFKVYNTFNKKSYDITTGSPPNAASMVFELFGKNESILFLGDLEQESADIIYNKYKDELNATYVQAAHHGQNLDSTFYDKIETNGVFVDAPEWLRQKDDDMHTAYENIKYFDEKEWKIMKYDTTPNIVLIN